MPPKRDETGQDITETASGGSSSDRKKKRHSDTIQDQEDMRPSSSPGSSSGHKGKAKAKAGSPAKDEVPGPVTSTILRGLFPGGVPKEK